MSSEETIAALISRFGKAYTQFLHRQLADCGTTPARSKLLATVMCSGSLKMNDISHQLGVTPRNVTKLVDALEEEGLLQRAPHPDDRRATLISLTGDGTKVAKSGMMQNEKANELFDTLSQRDKGDLRRVLQRLLDELESLSPGDEADG